MIKTFYTPYETRYRRNNSQFSISNDPVASFFLGFGNKKQEYYPPTEYNQYKPLPPNLPLPGSPDITEDDYLELRRIQKERQLEEQKESRRKFRSKLDATREARGWTNTVRGISNDARAWYRYAKEQGWV